MIHFFHSFLQIRIVENEMKKDAEEKNRLWGTTTKPKLEKQIDDLVSKGRGGWIVL